jgi:hypothetical protein
VPSVCPLPTFLTPSCAGGALQPQLKLPDHSDSLEVAQQLVTYESSNSANRKGGKHVIGDGDDAHSGQRRKRTSGAGKGTDGKDGKDGAPGQDGQVGLTSVYLSGCEGRQTLACF